MKRYILAIFILFVLSSTVSAATFTDFEQITNQSAVIMLTDLGVLSGYEDGNFLPNNTMSRAEISKVMAVLSTETMVVSEEINFLDIQDSWAKDYIEYCASTGIISGSNGYFRPEDNLTVRELCKMLLVLIGEKEDTFVGENWSENVETYANYYGLLSGFQGELDRYVTRDRASLLINNALQCDVILGYDENELPIYNLDDMRNPKSLLETRFGAVLVQGVVEANGLYDLRTPTVAMEENRIHISGYTKDFQVSEEIAINNDILGHKITIYAIFGTDYNRIIGTVDSYAGESSIFLENAFFFNLLFNEDRLGLTENTRCFMEMEEVLYTRMDYYITVATAITMIDHDTDGELEFIFMSFDPYFPEEEEGSETESLDEIEDIS